MSDLPPTPAGEPGDESEPTRPIPPADPTQPLWGFPTTPPPAAAPGYYGPAPAQRSARRTGFVAGVVAAALVVGGGAGLGAAALYSHDHASSDAIFSTTATGTSSAADTTATQSSVEAVAKRVLPSVVMIEVAGSTESGSGSGIILSSTGLILTNNHVVAIAGKSGQIRVDFNDGTQATAKIVGTDPLTDTAVIRAEGVSGLQPATFGNSSALQVGQSVVAIGSPFGLDSTVTSGIVSALNRPVDVGQEGNDSADNQTVYPAIQTDAAINPGNSGGALVNLSGQVVGINASIQTADQTSAGTESGSIGLGFAIPIDEVMPVIRQMINGETPTHARLGITVSDVGADTSGNSGGNGNGGSGGSSGGSQGFPGFTWPFGNGSGGSGSGSGGNTGSVFTTMGAQVQSVTAGSPAAQAGLKVGDIITKVDNQLISGSDSLVATIRSYRPGNVVTLIWKHDGHTETGKVTLESDVSGSNS